MVVGVSGVVVVCGVVFVGVVVGVVGVCSATVVGVCVAGVVAAAECHDARR